MGTHDSDLVDEVNLKDSGDNIINPRKEDGHGSQATDPTFIEDETPADVLYIEQGSLADGASTNTGWLDIADYPSISLNFNFDQDIDVVFEYAMDAAGTENVIGTNQTFTFEAPAPGIAFTSRHTISNPRQPFFRITVTNNSGTDITGDFLLLVRGFKSIQQPNILPLDDPVQSFTPATTSRSVITGRRLDDSFDFAELDEHAVDFDNKPTTPLTNGTVETFTVDDTTDELIDASHGLTDGDAVVLTTTGTLPGGLDDVDADGNEVPYWVVNATTDRFQVATSVGGSPVDITDTGTGTHSYQQRGQFVGSFEDYSQVGHLLPFIVATSPPAHAVIEWSEDGVSQVTGTLVNETALDTVELEAAGLGTLYVAATPQNTMVRQYGRLRYVNGSTDWTPGLDEVTIFVGKDAYPGSFGGLDEDLSLLSTAMLVRAVLSGRRRDGTFANLAISQSGGLQVQIENSPATQSGSLFVESLRNDIDINWTKDTPSGKLTDLSSGGTASLISSEGQIGFNTGTNDGDTSIFESTDFVNYNAGHEVRGEFTAEWTQAPTGPSGTSYIMLGTQDNGFGFGYKGTDFGLLYRRAGVDTFVKQEDWNIDPCLGGLNSSFTEAGEPVPLPPGTDNLFRIRFEWLGAAPIFFDVKTPDGEWINVHIIRYPANNTGSSITETDLPIRVELDNTGTTTDVELRSGSWHAGLITSDSELPWNRLFKSNEGIDGALPSGAAPPFDAVGPITDPNVVDTGWIFVGEQFKTSFLHAQFDVDGVDLYVFDASDDQGSNISISGFTTPTATSNANIPINVSAPFFQDYVRVVAINDTGSSATTWKLRLMGARDPPGEVFQSLDQPIFEFFPAPVVQTVQKGQEPDGSFTSIRKQGEDPGSVSTTPLGGPTTIDTFTADENTNTLTTASPHGLSDGDLVILDTTGVLPSGLETDRAYFVANASGSDLQLRRRFSGPVIDFLDSQSGTHTLKQGDVFRGNWFKWQDKYVGFLQDVNSDVPGTLLIDFSESDTPTDGVDTDVDDVLLEFYDPADIGFLRRITPTQSRHVRLRYVNGNTAQSEFTIQGAFTTTAPPLVMKRLSLPPTKDNLAGIVDAVQWAETPDGEFKNRRVSDTVAAMSTSNLLAADQEFVSSWVETTGFEFVNILINADQASADGGLVIQYAATENPLDEDILSEFAFTYTPPGAATEAGDGIAFGVPTQAKFVRIKYLNGSTGQNRFRLEAQMDAQNLGGAVVPFTTSVAPQSLAELGRTEIIADDGSGELTGIGQGANGGLDVGIVEHEVETPIESLVDYEVGQTNVTSTTPVQILQNLDPLTRAVSITNLDPDLICYFGPTSGVTQSSGGAILPLGSKDIELGPGITSTPEFHLIAQEPDTPQTTDTHKLDGDTTDDGGTVTNEANCLLSDDLRTSFIDQGDFVNVSGFDATAAQTQDVVSKVEIGFEGRKSPSGGKQTVEIAETTTKVQTTGTSITTTGSLTQDQNGVYVAFVTFRDTSVTAVNAEGMGMTWNKQTTVTNSGNGIKMAVFVSQDQPSSSGSITVNFSASVSASAIIAHRLTGVDLTTRIHASNTATGTGTAWSVTPSADESTDLILAAVGVNGQTSNTPGTPDVEPSGADINQGGAAAERITLASQYRPGDTTPTDGTLAASNPWCAIGLTINSADLEDPEMLLEYEVNAEGNGPTTLTQTLTSTGDNTFKVDVTGDRAWDYTDLDNTTVKLTLNNAGSATAQIDHIFIEYEEGSEGGVIRVAFEAYKKEA